MEIVCLFFFSIKLKCVCFCIQKKTLLTNLLGKKKKMSTDFQWDETKRASQHTFLMKDMNKPRSLWTHGMKTQTQ